MSNRPQRQKTRGGKGWSAAGRLGSSALLAALLLAVGAPSAAAQDPDRIAVLPLEIVGDIPAGRPALEAAVLRGLTVAASPTMSSEEADGRLQGGSARLPCDSPDCWSAVGKAVEARYLVTGRVERKENLFQVEFRVIDARAGRLLARETNSCAADDCSVAELCRLVVRELARQTLTQPDVTAAPAADSNGDLPPPAPLVDTATGGPAADQPATWWTPRRKWAVAALVGGAAIGAGGGYLIYVHNSCAERFPDQTMLCARRRGSDKNEALIGGIAAAGAGVGLVTTGIVMLLTGRPADEVSPGSALGLSIAPGHLLLSGRF